MNFHAKVVPNMPLTVTLVIEERQITPTLWMASAKINVMMATLYRSATQILSAYHVTKIVRLALAIYHSVFRVRM